jgi:exonuclease SbcC
MRLHHLEITAFGPFNHTVTVDFDELSAAGLFLLTGPTGAGKSSVLDAVCFALYGDVPGDRASAKRLRCDTAAPGVAPRVVLEATLADRRFRLTRSPAWQRPKRRGAGLTTEQASVLVEELTPDGLRLLTYRLDEAGHLVSELLGMNLTQFCQVAMLPQGRFQEFLRARSEERQRLLQKLFRTRRFEDIERWLREHRLGLRRRLDQLTAELAALAHRLDEAGAADHDLDALLADDLALEAWAAELLDESVRAAVMAAETADASAADAAAAEAALAEGTARAALQERHAAARAQRSALAAGADRVHTMRAQVEAGRRASPVLALTALAHRARTRRAQADCRLAELVAQLSDEASGDLAADPGAAGARRDQLTLALGTLPVVRGLEREFGLLRDRSQHEVERLAALAAHECALIARAEALPTDITALTARQGDAARDRDQLDTVLAGLEAARLRHAAAVELTATRLGQEAARGRLREFVDAHQGVKETWLALHEARLHGMAAEIAVDLAVGASCPVCGSCEHPHKASPGAGAPTAESEKAARRATDDAEVARQAQADIVRGLDTRLAILAEQSGGLDAATALGALDAARQEADRVRASAGQWAAVTADLDQALAQQAATAADLEQTRVEAATMRSDSEARLARLADIGHQLTEHLGPHQSADNLEAVLRRDLAVVSDLVSADHAVATALEVEAQAQSDVVDAARAQGFESAHDALDAALSTAEVDGLEAQLTTYAEQSAAAEATLADPEVASAAREPRPDLSALTIAHQQLVEKARLAHSAHDAASRRQARIGALQRDTLLALKAWRPVRDAHALSAQVSAFVEGKSGDNRAQMRLSAYVLAWRLGHVVAAANVRLAAMTGQRFTLEHTSQRGAGETRGGLSLLVRDEWSGESRDPVTLSGGETFVVSLALALGLTDVVTQEAGGADIGTLFVDEGFGSLDADTLDDVMDTLDALRDGGRAVGIVSHVPELRTRIPTQLRVIKSRSGSGLQHTHEAG